MRSFQSDFAADRWLEAQPVFLGKIRRLLIYKQKNELVKESENEMKQNLDLLNSQFKNVKFVSKDKIKVKKKRFSEDDFDLLFNDL